PNTHSSGHSRVGVPVQRPCPTRRSSDLSFSSVSEVFNTATGTTSWSYALAASALTDNVQYTVRSQAKDNAINKNVQTTPASATSTYDTTPPTSSRSFPASRPLYNAAGWT